MTLAVAFTVSALRQSYLRKALDSWCQVRGVRDVLLLFCCEPERSFPVAEFRDYLQRAGLTYQIRVNERRLMCLANTRRAMETAFAQGAEFAVLADEDVEVSADILEYYAWAAGTYRADSQVSAVCAHAFYCDPGCGPELATRISWFSPIGWGTWRDRWEEYIAPEWHGIACNADAWDANLREQVQRDGHECVFPVRSRTQHLGELSTITPGMLASHFYTGSVSTCFARDYGPQDYREVPREPALKLVV